MIVTQEGSVTLIPMFKSSIYSQLQLTNFENAYGRMMCDLMSVIMEKKKLADGKERDAKGKKEYLPI